MAEHKADQSLFTQQAGLHQETAVVSQSTAAVTPGNSGVAGVAPTTAEKSMLLSKKPKISGKTLLIAVPIGILLILFIAVQIKNSSSPMLPLAPNTVPSISDPGSNVDRSPILQRLTTLKAELQQAEPTQQEFSFPPVDGTISLDDKN